jgi:hypothetical protein
VLSATVFIGFVRPSHVKGGPLRKCPFCAEEIQDAAIVCKHCGRDLRPTVAPAIVVATPAAPRPPKWAWVVAGLGFLASLSGLRVGVAVAVLLLWVGLRPIIGGGGLRRTGGSFLLAILLASVGGAMTGSTPARVASPTDDTQALALRRAIVGVGERCDEVTRVFRQGSRPDTGTFWNVGCRDGNAYSVQVKGADDYKILSCAMLRAVAHLECFKTFEQQR